MIDAVLVTSDSREQVLECVAHLRVPEVGTIVVVDNGSSDGTAEAVRQRHPDVKVVSLTSATGLAAALNRGAETGDAPFVLYVNDDVFAVPGSVGALLEALLARDDAVAAGGRLVNDDLSTQDSYRPRPFPSAPAMVARLVGLERVWPRNPLTGSHLRRPLDDHATVEVDQPAGACLLVRRSVLARVGGWDERYWVWYEDVDFTRRLSAQGPLLYVPSAPFRHVGGATARRLSAPSAHRRYLHGALQYARTHLSRPGAGAVALATVLVCLVRAMRSDRASAETYLETAREAWRLLVGR